MRIAVFGDVHGNYPALEAVYRHLQQKNALSVYCLGDLVNQNVWNNEVVEFIHTHNIRCVLGNHDEGIGHNRAIFPFSFSSVEEDQWGREAIQFTLKQLTDENKKVLRGFPLKIKVNINTGGKRRTIVFAHGTPDSNTERLYRFYRRGEMADILEKEEANVLLIGNTHTSFHTIIQKAINGRNAYLHVINPGSVGCPKDGSWHACYAMLDFDLSKDLLYEEDALQVHFYRLDYDINSVIKAIKKSGLPLYYGGRLLKY